MKRRSQVLILWVGVLVLLGLTACQTEGPEVIHEEVGAAETQIAQTEWARENPSPTPGPSPTPLPTGTPYVIPSPPPEMDPQAAITRVGNETITLEEYRKRVRYERFQPLWLLARRAERQGVDQVLDLTNPDNFQILSLFSTLSARNDFGRQVQRVMVIEEIVLQEAARRQMDVNPFQFDAQLALAIGMQVTEGGELPPGFDERYAEFLEGIDTYANMSENEFRRIIRARTLYNQLSFLIQQEPEAIPTTGEVVSGVEVQDIVVDTLEEAEDVVARLEAGEAMGDIAQSFGLNAEGGAASRVVGIGNQVLPASVIDAIFAAEPDTVVGPLPTSEGWYVAWVIGEKFDALSPSEIEAYRERYFLDWVESRMDDPLLVEDYDNWLDYTPVEPLPRDVSPLLTEEYIIMPDLGDPFELELTDTPEPGTTLDAATEAAPETGAGSGETPVADVTPEAE